MCNVAKQRRSCVWPNGNQRVALPVAPRSGGRRGRSTKTWSLTTAKTPDAQAQSVLVGAPPLRRGLAIHPFRSLAFYSTLYYSSKSGAATRVFKTRWFTRFAAKERITDDRLAEAVARAERGLIDADLGGGLIKQRVARAGKGKSGGYRTLIAYRRENGPCSCSASPKATATTSLMTSSWI